MCDTLVILSVYYLNDIVKYIPTQLNYILHVRVCVFLPNINKFYYIIMRVYYEDGSLRYT